MGINSFLRHKCDIYFGSISPTAESYGLPIADNEIIYSDKPDIVDCVCYFSTNEVKILEREPYSTYIGANELCLPSGIQIKKGDKVVDKRYNLEYTLGFPENIRGKYISVPLYRTDNQERL